MGLRNDNRVMTYRGILKRQNINNLNRSFDTGFYEVSPSEVDPSIGFPALEFTEEDLIDTLFPYIAKSSNKPAIEKDVDFSTTYLSKIIKHYTENKNYCSGMLEIISDDDMAIQTFHRLPDGLVSERTYDKEAGVWSEWVMEVPTVVKQFRKNPYTLKEIREKILDKYNMSGNFLSSLLGIQEDLQTGLDELFAKEDHLDFAYDYDFRSKLYFVPGYVKWYFYSIVDMGYGPLGNTDNTNLREKYSVYDYPSWFPEGDTDYRLLQGQIAPNKNTSRTDPTYTDYFSKIEEVHYINGDLANRISKDYGISNIYHHFFNTHNKWTMSNMVINIKEKLSNKINGFLEKKLRKEREETFSLAKIDSGVASDKEKGNTTYTFSHITVEDVKNNTHLKNLVLNQSRRDYINGLTTVSELIDVRAFAIDNYGFALYKGDMSTNVEVVTGIHRNEDRWIVPNDHFRFIHLRPRVNSLFHENYGLRRDDCYIPQINFNFGIYNINWNYLGSSNLPRPGKDFYNNHINGLSDTVNIPIHEDNWFRINLPQYSTVGYHSENKNIDDLNRPIYVQYFSSYNDLKFRKMTVSSYEKHFVINNENYSVVDPIEFNFVAGNQYKYGMLPLYEGNTLNETSGEWSLGTDERDRLIAGVNNFIIPGYEPWGNSLIFPSNKTHNKIEDDSAHQYDKGHSKVIVNNRCKPFVIDGYILKGQVITKSSLDRSEPLVSKLSVSSGGTMAVPIKKYQKVYQYLNRDIRTFDTRELDNIISAIEIEFVSGDGLQYILFLRPGEYYRYHNNLFEYRSKDNNWDEIEFRGITSNGHHNNFSEYTVSIYTREYIL